MANVPISVEESVHKGGNTKGTEIARQQGTYLGAAVFSEIRKTVERHGARWVNENGTSVLPCV